MPALARRPVRLIVAGLSAGVLLFGAAACGDSNDEDKDKGADASTTASAKPASCEDVKSGKTSDSVKVTGAFGKQQKADFDDPLESDGMERTLLTKGTGATPKAGDELDILLSVFSGKDGTAFGSQQSSIKVGDAQIPDAFRAGFDCLPIGSRAVVTVPASDVYGAEGNSQAGISGDDTLVIVTDVIGKVKPLKPAAWTKNPPTVTFAKDGKPTMKLPAGKPATQLLLKVLRPGTGKVVAKGDTVTVDYQGTSWNTGKVFDQSYGKPPTQPDCARVCFATDEVVPGFGAALVGQKVGTRLVVTMPPKYGYGEKGASQSELAGQTLVFVVEIKDTKSAG